MTFLWSLGVFAFVVVIAGNAGAQCAFDAIGNARGVRSSMVRSFAPCPSSENPVINTATQGNTPACTPVSLEQLWLGSDSDYSFTDKGGCVFDARAKVEPDCALLEGADGVGLGLPSGPCHFLHLAVRCKGIVRADGLTPIHGTEDESWSLSLLSRVTLNDPTRGDMTVIDIPSVLVFPEPKNGTITLTGSLNEALSYLVGPDGAGMPTCTQVELLDVTVRDAFGHPFAKLGSGTR